LALPEIMGLDQGFLKEQRKQMMNNSMKKTFLIQERTFKEISEGKGHLEYKLIDENGDARVVTATARNGRIRELSHIKAVYKREIPLVKALMKASVNDTVYVDFTKYNRKNPRANLVSESRSRSYKGAYSSNLSSSYIFDGAHILRLLGISIIGFVTLLMFKVFT
jgi:hypothetical protein